MNKINFFSKYELNWGLLSKYRTEMYGIAAVMIMIFHMMNIVPLPYNVKYLPFELPQLIGYFNVGVDIFLFLSGISLYFSQIKKRQFSDYLKARYERTILPYIIISAPHFVYFDLIYKKQFIKFFTDITGISLFVALVDDKWIPFYNTMWYVTFAFISYIIYPALFFLFFKIPKKKNLKIIIFILLAGLSIIFTVCVKKYVPDYYETVEIYLTRIPIFLLGCCIGNLVYEKRNFNKNTIFIIAGCTIIAGMYFLYIRKHLRDLIYRRYFGIVLAVLFCLIVPVLLEIFHSKRLNKLLQFFGKISLELYITHLRLSTVIDKVICPGVKQSDAWTTMQKFTAYLIVMLLSVIISKVFSICYSKLLKALKSRNKKDDVLCGTAN